MNTNAALVIPTAHSYCLMPHKSGPVVSMLGTLPLSPALADDKMLPVLPYQHRINQSFASSFAWTVLMYTGMGAHQLQSCAQPLLFQMACSYRITLRSDTETDPKAPRRCSPLLKMACAHVFRLGWLVSLPLSHPCCHLKILSCCHCHPSRQACPR